MSGIDESKKTSEDDCGAGRCDWGKSIACYQLVDHHPYPLYD